MVPSIYALFIRDLCKALGNIREEGYHVVLRMNANADVRDREVSKVLLAIRISEAVISNYRGERVPATCATNTKRKPIDSIWISFVLAVLKYRFLSIHNVFRFNSDHQLIWAKICKEDLYGYHSQHVSRIQCSM